MVFEPLAEKGPQDHAATQGRFLWRHKADVLRADGEIAFRHERHEGGARNGDRLTGRQNE
jgi:hypothetical protein